MCLREVSAVTNVFDRPRMPLHLNGSATSPHVMSPLDGFDAMPTSPPCPRCSIPMWFSRLEPHPTKHATVDNVTFQCVCGELLTQSLPR
jgi:hypothetical protein